MLLHVYITISVKPHRKKRGKGKDFSKVPAHLQRQIEACTNLSGLHNLFLSTGRKNRAVMNAFIDKREILEFNERINNPHLSPKNNQNNGSSIQPTAA